MADKTIWVCAGGCGAKKSEEEHAAGKTKCGNPACANFGKPFEKRIECGTCGARMRGDEQHTCDSC